MPRFLPAACCLALAACTSPNPNAILDGSPGGTDGPWQSDGRRPGTLGGPCLPGALCDPGLKCVGGICVPESDGGRWDLPPLPDGPPLHDQPPTCPPVGFKNVLVRSHSGGDWTVVLEPQTKVTALTVSSASTMQAAAALDYDVAGDQVAGFVVSRSSDNNSPEQEATGALQAVGKNLAGLLTVRRQGTSGTTLDGFQAVAGITVDFETEAGTQTNIALVRKQTVAALLKVPVANVGGWPATFGTQTTQFVIRVVVVRRTGGRTLFMGAVTDRGSDDDINKLVSSLAGDLASSTLLGQAGVQPGHLCDTQTVTVKPKNEVDIIWVMDESGSMDVKRDTIAAGTSTFFSQLQQTGLSFRMGVTNVVNPDGTYSAAVGKFCSSLSSDPYSMGGTDRFLLPTEQNIFKACIKNPPGFEGGLEFGLVNSQEAVKLHLPRAQNSTDKIRTDAQVVVIMVTDEAPQGLKDLFSSGGGNPLGQCVLNAASQAKVDAHVKPIIDYLSGNAAPEAAIDYYQVIGGLCTSSGPGCVTKPEVAHGYNELAQALNGKVYDVCQSVTASVSAIIGDIVTSSSPLKLKSVPIASSLAVALDGATVQRSNVSGFKHRAGTKSLQFTGGTKVQVGSTVVVSYRVWP